MARLMLKVKKRDKVGKNHTKKLRREGFVPAIIYGPHLEKGIPVKVELPELKRFLSSLSEEDRIFALEFANEDKEKPREVIIKDTQYNWLKGEIEHIDFYEITRGEVISTKVPLRLVGKAPGVKKGGVVEQVVRELEIECLPEDMPAHIDVDLKDLDIGDSLRVKDIKLPRGVKIVTNPEEVVVSVLSPISEEELEKLEEEKGVEAEEVQVIEKERKEKEEVKEEKEEKSSKKEE